MKLLDLLIKHGKEKKYYRKKSRCPSYIFFDSEDFHQLKVKCLACTFEIFVDYDDMIADDWELYNANSKTTY